MLIKRLPPFNQIISVYAVIAFMLFAWMALLFAWNLPAWLKFMPPGAMLAVFSYSIFSSFIESLVVLSILIAICFVLPSRWLRDKFIVRGTVIAICLLSMIMLRSYLNTTGGTKIGSSTLIVWIIILLAAFMSFLFTAIPILRNVVLEISDRLLVFIHLAPFISHRIIGHPFSEHFLAGYVFQQGGIRAERFR